MGNGALRGGGEGGGVISIFGGIFASAGGVFISRGGLIAGQ